MEDKLSFLSVRLSYPYDVLSDLLYLDIVSTLWFPVACDDIHGCCRYSVRFREILPARDLTAVVLLLLRLHRAAVAITLLRTVSDSDGADVARIFHRLVVLGGIHGNLNWHLCLPKQDLEQYQPFKMVCDFYGGTSGCNISQNVTYILLRPHSNQSSGT